MRFYIILPTILLVLASVSPTGASLDVRGGTQLQQRLILSLYRQTIPGKLCRSQTISIQLLTDKAMGASIHDPAAQKNDDERDAIDGIYQDDPPRILLRASRPPAELRQVFTHEYGHFVWSCVLNANQRDAFRRIYDVSRDEQHLVSDYAAASVDEGFAETFSCYVLHARLLAGLDPRAYAFFSAISVSAQIEPHGLADPGQEWEERDPAR